MRKRALSLALALALCLSLCVPAFAAGGTTKVLESKDNGVRVTIEGFLREESYGLDRFYVVKDDAKITYSLMDGFESSFFGYATYNISDGILISDFSDGISLHDSNREWIENWWGPAVELSLRTDRFILIRESDFAKLKPVEMDIRCSNWAKETICAAYQKGLLDGVDVNYIYDEYDEDGYGVGSAAAVDGYTNNITREDFALMMVQLYRNLGGSTRGVSTETPFTDFVRPPYIAVYFVYDGVEEEEDMIGYAYNLGFVNGTSATTFSPNATLTREQAATMLARVYAKVYGDIPAATKTSFADDASIASWAKSGVAFMADKGIINGVGNNKFAPQSALTIEQAVAMAYRMLPQA